MAAVYIPTNSQVPEISQTVSFPATVGLFYVISGSAAVTATLPTAVGNSGGIVRIRCSNGYTGLCTIATTSSQTLGPGAATSQIIYAGETVIVQSDGSNWVRTGGFLIPCLCKLVLSSGNQTVPYNTNTIVTLNSISVDSTGQMGQTVTHSIKIIRPGFYHVTGVAFWAAIGTVGYNFYTSINSSVSLQSTFYQTAYGASGVSNYTQTVTSLGTLQLVVGDNINLQVLQQRSDGSGTSALLGAASGSTITSLEVQELPLW